jgi:hypothetical protein
MKLVGQKGKVRKKAVRPSNRPRISSGIVRVLAPTNTTNITDVQYHGGPILTNVKVEEIFWGSWWQENPDFVVKVNHAISTILSSPYMTELQQYGGIQRGSLSGNMIIVDTPLGQSPADPPQVFKHEDLEDLISNLINNKRVSDPETNDQLLYCVFLPIDCRYEDPSYAGEHSYFPKDGLGTKIHYAWVLNDGTLDSRNSIPKVFSHELVEACTDPELNHAPGFVHERDANGNEFEIGDTCENEVGMINGVIMQAYWSQRHRRCILPAFFPTSGLRNA